METQNPFVIVGKIPRNLFCDRESEREKFVKILTNNGNITLMAERRIGKSKLIDVCFSEPVISEKYYTFYIDLLYTLSLNELVYAFGKEVFTTLKKKNTMAAKQFIAALKSINTQFSYDASTGLPTFSIGLGDVYQPEYTLEEIFNALEHADKPCIVALDEFQQIAKYSQKNIEALLRSHIQNASNVHFIFSGSEQHLISEMFLSSARPFYNSTDIIELKPIAYEKYMPFVKNRMDSVGSKIAEDNIKYIYDLLEGNTYCMQKVFHELVASNIKDCTIEQIDKTISSILEELSDSYKRLMSNIPIRQKELMYAIAKEGHATKILSSTFIRKHSLQSASSVQVAIAKLQDLGIVSHNEKSYFIQDNFFRLFLLE